VCPGTNPLTKPLTKPLSARQNKAPERILVHEGKAGSPVSPQHLGGLDQGTPNHVSPQYLAVGTGDNSRIEFVSERMHTERGVTTNGRAGGEGGGRAGGGGRGGDSCTPIPGARSAPNSPQAGKEGGGGRMPSVSSPKMTMLSRGEGQGGGGEWGSALLRSSWDASATSSTIEYGYVVGSQPTNPHLHRMNYKSRYTYIYLHLHFNSANSQTRTCTA
jgi:hypothetical protein